jgi:LPS-assembly protein
MRLSAVAWLALLCALLCGATPLVAQVGGPILLADSVRVDPEDRSLIAEGNVEVFYGGVSLRAARAIYRDGADRVEIQGPIRLTGTDGGTVVLADAASLSADLQDGLLQGARLLLAQELQLTAARVERIGGRYARLSNSFATSCRVCAGGAAPWWEIRAREVIYDQIERQIYFRNAQIRAFGVPIAWLPRLRLPDPTVDRMTGLLPPVLRNSSKKTSENQSVGCCFFDTLFRPQSYTAESPRLLVNCAARKRFVASLDLTICNCSHS